MTIQISITLSKQAWEILEQLPVGKRSEWVSKIIASTGYNRKRELLKQAGSLITELHNIGAEFELRECGK
jgi:hypothetical protein